MIHWTDCTIIIITVFFLGICLGGILESKGKL